MSKTTLRNILIILIVLLILYFLFFRKNKGAELFTQDLHQQQQQQQQSHHVVQQPNIINSHQTATSDIDDLLIDKLKCHPDCCGDSQYTPFDGLTSDQIKQTISTGMKGGPYVRTNYTCANGPNGAGCPCITKDAYLNLANRAQNVWTNEYIEPTLAVGGYTWDQSSQYNLPVKEHSIAV